MEQIPGHKLPRVQGKQVQALVLLCPLGAQLVRTPWPPESPSLGWSLRICILKFSQMTLHSQTRREDGIQGTGPSQQLGVLAQTFRPDVCPCQHL